MRETFMNGQDEEIGVCSPANETAAQVVAYFGPYLFWGAVSAIAWGIVVFAGAASSAPRGHGLAKARRISQRNAWS